MDEKGQALVEFALVIPIFLMLLLGILQFGIVFNNYITLTDAARAGSRVAAVSRQDSCPTCKAKAAVKKMGTKKARLLNELRTKFLESGEADALMWVNAFNPQRMPPAHEVPTIVLAPPGARFAREPEVFIPIGTPGVDHAGHLFRADKVVALPPRSGETVTAKANDKPAVDRWKGIAQPGSPVAKGLEIIASGDTSEVRFTASDDGVYRVQFQTTAEGTGVVHLAPAYGEDDQNACAAAVKRQIPDLKPREFHVNVVHESQHYLRNADLSLRSAVDPDALARACEEYAKLRGFGWSPVNYLERAYLRHVRRYLETKQTPMRCHALRASCFVDSWGNVFPCTIYDRKVGSLRDVDYELGRIWNAPETAALQREIWDYRCPQCWTPFEAYQSIPGNVLRPARAS